MNSSSIVMAFVIAAVVSVVAHQIVIGPIVPKPENAQQGKVTIYKGVINYTKQVSVKKVKKPL